MKEGRKGEADHAEGMAGTVLKMEGAEVALGGSGGTVMNLILQQKSGVAYLCKGAAPLLGCRAADKDATCAAPTRHPRGGEQAALGGAQILLGAVCIGLGVILSLAPTPTDPNYTYFFYQCQRVSRNQVPFWMGSLFILSGTFSVVGDRRGGSWVHLATVLNLASVVAGAVAFTLGLTEFISPTNQSTFVELLCKRREEHRSDGSWRVTTRPPYDDPFEQRRAGQCQAALWVLARMWTLTQTLLLILHSLALAIALFGFGYGLCCLCRSCEGACKDYGAVEETNAPPAPEEPGKEPNPA